MAAQGLKPPARRRVSPLPKIYRRLLARHGRQSWWPGDSPFEVMAGAVLTQNPAWGNVEKVIAKFRQARALSPQAIVKAPSPRLAAWLRPSGYFNVKARRLKALCRWLLGRGDVAGLKNSRPVNYAWRFWGCAESARKPPTYPAVCLRPARVRRRWLYPANVFPSRPYKRRRGLRNPAPVV